MKRTMKRTLSVLLATLFLLSAFSAGSGTLAADTGYQKGDVIEFGLYPQSQVTDEETLAALNDLRITWKSYGYYGYAYPFQNVETGMTQIPYDRMKYADVQLNGMRYRAVRITDYRPVKTDNPWGSTWTEQIKNGYLKDTTYWFCYEPLRWRILDADEQLVISESIIDAQPYSNTCFYSEDGKTYKDYTCTVDFRNYEYSSIREFLNDASRENGFADLAFSEDEWNAILTTYLDNRDDAQLRDKTGEDTDDKVFLPSADMMNDTWYWAGQHATDQEQWAARKAVGTDYAHCQGLHGNPVTKEAGYLLRTMNANTQSGGGEYCVNPSGGPATASTSALSIYYGVRPAMRIDLSALPADSHTLYGGKCGEKLVWRFDDGEMRVEGSGAMTEFENVSACPWHPLRDQIQFITVKDTAYGNVSSISAYAFQDCPNLSEAYLSGVQKIGTHAFYGCDQLCYVTTFAEQLTAQNAFSVDNPILRIYCQSARVQRAVQSMGCTGLILAEEDHVLSVPGTLQINSSTPLIHLPQWVSFFTDAQWIHFDQMVFDGVLPSVLAARNASFSDAGAASLTLSDFYCSWYTLNSQALNITSAAVLAGLQDETCAAFFGDPEFGRHIEFGSYPQTEVKNADLTNALLASATEWTSYGYYSGDGATYGSMQPGDFMQYTDVEYEGVRYRGVKILANRPNMTYGRASTSYAAKHYETGTYWFRWEPLSWRILDTDEGLVFSENVLDFQPFHNIYYANNESAYMEQGLSFPGNYAESSVRKWLNETFFNTAFTALEQDEIALSHNRTDAQGSDRYSNESQDAVFLPSIQELTAEQYGFLSSTNNDPARGSKEIKSRWTDYSKSQGMQQSSIGSYSFYAVRTATDVTMHMIVSEYGEITSNRTDVLRGIRPVMRIDPELLTEKPDDPPVDPQNPLSGTCGADVRWAFDEESGVLSLGGTGAMDSLDAFEEYGYSVWKEDIQFVAAADGVTSIGAHAFEGCPILEEVILGEDVTQIGEAAFLDCPRLMNVTLLSATISADDAFPNDRMEWMLIFPDENTQAIALAKRLGLSWIPVTYYDNVLSFGGTITVHDGYAYSYLPMFIQRYGSAQKVYFNRLVFADVPTDSVEKQDYTGDYFGCLTMFYVEVSLIYVSPDGEQREVTYDEMIGLLQSGDYRAFKLRVSTPTDDGKERTQEETIYEKLEEILPFMPRKVLRLVSKAINFIVSIFKKK